MRLEGTISKFDPATRKGVITDLTGAEHLVLPGSFRRTVRLGVADRVSFSSFNFSAGPTAQDIEKGPIDSPSMAGLSGRTQAPALNFGKSKKLNALVTVSFQNS